MKKISDRLLELCNTIPQKLSGFSEEIFSNRPASGKWSKKEELGHLIDSAANNHHRFIRVQYQDNPVIFYNPDEWVSLNHYQNKPAKELIALWELYNRHLAFVVERIPTENLKRTCTVQTGGQGLTLQFIIEDYLEHMEHHLEHIVL